MMRNDLPCRRTEPLKCDTVNVGCTNVTDDGWVIAYAARNIVIFGNKIKVLMDRYAQLLVALCTVFDLSDLRSRQEY